MPQNELAHKILNKNTTRKCMVVWRLHPSSDVYSHPEEEEHGAQTHEDGGNHREGDLLNKLARELGRCDLVDKEPAEETNLDSLPSRYQSRISLVYH